MMLTIHGLPTTVKYADLKHIIKEECNIIDFILDNLVADDNGPGKKMRVGLANNDEGTYFMKRLDGYRMGNHVLRVVPVGKAPQQNQPQNSYNSYGNQPRGNYSQPGNDYMAPQDRGSWGQGGVQWDTSAHQGPAGVSRHPGPGMHQQQVAPQNTYPYQQQGNAYPQQQAPQPSFGQRDSYREPYVPSHSQSYGYQPKQAAPPGPLNTSSPRPGRHNVLRSVEITDTPLSRGTPPASQPYRPSPQDKPITIAKDKFQGPSYQQFGQQPSSGYRDQASRQPAPWAHQASTQKSPQQPFSKPTSAPFVTNPYDNKPPYHDDKKYPQPSSKDTRGILKVPEGFSRKEDVQKRDDGRGYQGRDAFRDAIRREDFAPRRGDDDLKRKNDIGIGGPIRIRGDLLAKRDDFPPRRDDPAKRDDMPGRREDFRIRDDGPRRDSPGRRPSPGRRVSPHGKRVSPGRRPLSPGRRPLSPGRRPLSPGRRPLSPGRRPLSPGRRPLSPGRRPLSPGRRPLSPGRRPLSPGRGRRGSPPRKSPNRYNQGSSFPKAEQYMPETSRDSGPAPNIKSVRPAYEPTTIPAQNQAIFSGSYRPNLAENVQYPIPGQRPIAEQRNSPWQDKPTYSGQMKKPDDERRDYSRPFDRRSSDIASDPKPIRRSRSPLRRERSPPRDRFKRHSPSPRSPRRSWALEKRSSPETQSIPPPPSWPGQNASEQNYSRPGEKRGPVWELSKDHSGSRFDDFSSRNQDASRQMPPPPKRRESPTSDVWKTNRVPEKSSREPPKFGRPDDFDRRSPGPSKGFPERGYSPRESFRPNDAPRRDDGPREFFSSRPDDLRRNDNETDEQREYDRVRRRDDSPQRRDESPGRRDDRYDERSRRIDDNKNGGRGMERDDQLVKIHRTKAADIIAKIIVEKHDARDGRIKEELQLSISKILVDLCGDRDISVEEMMSKFYQRYSSADQERVFDDVMSSLPSQLRPGKRRGEETEGRYDDKRPRVGDEPLEEKRKTQKELLKEKYKKTIEEIRRRILIKKNVRSSHEHFKRICEELSMTLLRILLQFGEKYGSSCDIMRKYETSYSDADENKMFQDILTKVQGETKRRADSPELASKSTRPSTFDMKQPDFQQETPMATTSRWDIPHPSASFSANPQMAVTQMAMLPNTFPTQETLNSDANMQSFDNNFEYMLPGQNFLNPNPIFQASPNVVEPSNVAEIPPNPFVEPGYNLYLCKDDFDPINRQEASKLKDFLVQQIFEATASQAHAPNFTLKGLQSLHRYEVTTEDPASKDWLLRLDFSRFLPFNVLVYTKEELWYERAAIWLPGHTTVKNIEPLVKLLLQNKNIDGLNIGKWKLVKKIDNMKGTRIYVDMPPSSARALEKQKMLLSYELQKVNVFLKAVAVDKDAFDSGLKEPTITDPSILQIATHNTPMPVIPPDPKIIKICLKGNKLISVDQAKRIKNMIIYKIFKYHQEPKSSSRTDFLKYGFIQPGYFGVLPENDSSGRWLKRLDIGKLRRHEIVILGDDESTTKFFKMYIDISTKINNMNSAFIFETLKQSNRGVNGLHFIKWKTLHIHLHAKFARQYFEIDLESVETLIKLHFRLDFQRVTVYVKHDYKHLDDLIKKYKAEATDKYDVANMELDSDGEDSDDVIMLD